MTKTFTFLFLLSFGISVAQSELDSHNFQFKGFIVSINDEITDADGNHILVGDARVKENYAKDRDARLDKLFKLDDFAIDNDSKGLIIFTDKAYNIIKLNGVRSSLKKILWDAANNCYWIGGSSAHFHKNYSYQLAVTRLSTTKEVGGTTGIETDGNTYFEDMILKDKNIVFLAMKMQGEIGKNEYIPTVVEINMNAVQDSKNYVWAQKVPKIIYQTETDYPKMYRFDFSPLFIKDGAVLFALGNAIDSEYGIHFYKYKDGKAEFIEEFGNIDAYRSPYLIGFLPTSDNKFLLAYTAYFSKKLTIARMDAFLQRSSEKETKLASHPDFNQLLELPNGKLVMLSVGSHDYWSYLIFDTDGTFLKEVETTISEDLHLSLFKILKGNVVVSSFYKHFAVEPTVLQTITID
jgi:hypothetical protein